MSYSLRPHGLQHTRLSRPSPTPGACSNSCPSSWWCHPTISSFIVPLLLIPLIFPSIRVFSNDSVLHIRWPKYWSFSFSTSPSNEYAKMISFRMDWFELLEVQGILKSLLQHHSLKASAVWCSSVGLIPTSSLHIHGHILTQLPLSLFPWSTHLTAAKGISKTTQSSTAL